MPDHPIPVRRMKTYTGGQGYVYQYYFVGRRTVIAGSAGGPALEYIFDVTADRKTTFSVSVFLHDAASKGWAASHRRALTDAEQYAAAKMRLFEAFDLIEDVMKEGRRLSIDLATLERLLAGLGVE